MANKDNKLSHLKIDNREYKELDFLFNTQAQLQSFIATEKGLPDITNKHLTIGERVEWLMKNKHAFDDEFSEMMDAVGGIKDGVGSAAWKWWKFQNKAISISKLTSLSKNDLIELKMEYVDMLHFFVNFGILLGITGSEVMNMYLAKNAENIERQKTGY